MNYHQLDPIAKSQFHFLVQIHMINDSEIRTLWFSLNHVKLGISHLFLATLEGRGEKSNP